jgi:oligopeptide/dipeptide ABC transporter ATP-binding protein
MNALMDLAEAAPIASSPLASVGSTPLLSVRGLKKHYAIKGGVFGRAIGSVKAVDGVDFDIHEGETLGLVGESGCGKSTLGSMIVGLNRPSAGRILLRDEDISGVSHQGRPDLCRDVQMVFQNPIASLNRRMRVFDIVAEPLIIHGLARGNALRSRVYELLAAVGLNPAQAERIPAQFSGGQRQRIGIARALALEPKLIVLDEPVSALDVSIQAQVLNLLKKLQKDLGLAYLFISHDLSVVHYMADRVAVMFLGKVVETSTREQLFREPSHPYTQALLSAVPSDNPFERSVRRRIVLKGDLPSPSNPPPGCSFHVRCFQAREQCSQEAPALINRAGCDHPVACFFPNSKT